MSFKKFIVIRCPKCGKWTYAKTKQKSRFCSRCEKQFKIDPVKVVYAENHKQAQMMVKTRNEMELYQSPLFKAKKQS